MILYFQAELNVTFSREVLSKIVAYSRSNLRSKYHDDIDFVCYILSAWGSRQFPYVIPPTSLRLTFTSLVMLTLESFWGQIVVIDCSAKPYTVNNSPDNLKGKAWGARSQNSSAMSVNWSQEIHSKLPKSTKNTFTFLFSSVLTSTHQHLHWMKNRMGNGL